ncbi:hypothetical protein Agub_g3364, partial [Astrephomene gubernaculifera]
MLESVAVGCDLATLQHWHRTLLKGQQLKFNAKKAVIAAAAGSPTPDWRAKIEWLEAQGYIGDEKVCDSASRQADALQRVTWLIQREYPVGHGVGSIAAAKGDVALLEHLLSEGWPLPSPAMAFSAAQQGRLEVLQLLHRHNYDFRDPFAMAEMARMGNVQGMAQLLEWAGDDNVAGWCDGWRANVVTGVLRSGSVEMLTWLTERGGGRWEGMAAWAAADSGCEEAMEWLEAHGFPFKEAPVAGNPYTASAQRGDLATLRCLRRLGCPWGPVGVTSTACVRGNSPLPVLRCLLEGGCPVDWEAAVAALPPACNPAMREWVLQQQRLAEQGQKQAEEEQQQPVVVGAEGMGPPAGGMVVLPGKRLRGLREGLGNA